ncbi:hypothetical protein FPOAC2_00052 [Fusarium poae]|jgi:hypothetical protein|uniref:hypothetical protein n=1 Tax=Fusarium poae TaxID=36050 RepID=UPI001CEA7D0A|nr:hypothetical protein FPOAC1_000041 [Fusarium poae]KAG8674078.1 hypothetical protein FPOAC1_000041 [Fusarium poae]
MTVYPEVLKKAQAEIDNVIGPDRLPGFEDRQNLPYINGMVKESLRWMPAVPIGAAHKADDDTYYDTFQRDHSYCRTYGGSYTTQKLIKTRNVLTLSVTWNPEMNRIRTVTLGVMVVGSVRVDY